jgi:hypothetical protein
MPIVTVCLVGAIEQRREFEVWLVPPSLLHGKVVQVRTLLRPPMAWTLQ